MNMCECKYCGSTCLGERCNSCGAPAIKQPIDEQEEKFQFEVNSVVVGVADAATGSYKNYLENRGANITPEHGGYFDAGKIKIESW